LREKDERDVIAKIKKLEKKPERVSYARLIVPLVFFGSESRRSQESILYISPVFS
jgi:hypothetical protein